MRRLKYLFLGVAATAALSLASCQDDFDAVHAEIPEASITPNTTIAELKDAFWQDETNYCTEIGTKENGDHYIIHGTVISSDEAGNIFKCLYIRDESAALPMSINRYNLYLDYRIGQEIVIDLTGMYVGKYNGMLQLGYPEWYEQGNCWETSFMAPVLFTEHAQLNGIPNPDETEPVLIKDLASIDKANSEDLKKWQGQLVRFNDAYFDKPGTTLCDEYHSSGFNQKLNVAGGSINIRTSGYAKFWNYKTPSEHLDVVGILGFYSGDWQLLLRNIEDLRNIGNATENIGTKNNPYSVDDVIAAETADSKETGWVKGYIVGAVAPEVVEVKSNDDIEFGSEVTLNNTLVIASDKECKDYTKCLVIVLPQDSKLRELGNLVSNPGNYQKEITLVGSFEKVMGTFGLGGNNGTLSEFTIEGLEVEGAPIETGNGSEATPYNPTQVLAGEGSGTGWIKGYIVGWIEGKSITDGSVFTVPATVASNILLATEPNCTDPTKCVPIQLVSNTDPRKALNLMDNPGNLGAVVSIEGSFEKYFNVNAVKNPTKYILNGGGSGGDTPSGDKKFTLLTGNVTGGKAYMFYAEGAAAKPVESATANYGWLYTQALAASNNTITAAESYGFVFTAANGGFNIRDNQGRYLYMSGTYDSFQLSKSITAGDATFVWTVSRNTDGTYKVTNSGNGKTIMYSSQYSSYGAYAEETGRVYPVLYEMEGTPSDPGETPDPTPTTGPGSENQPYGVSDVISGKASGTSVWVEGYIVGWVDGMTLSEGAKFNNEATVNTNIIIAPTADETNLANCIPVQLPAGEVRNALNLQANPGNYKQKVSLKGSVEKYFGTKGLKSVSAYKINGSGSGGGSVNPPVDGGTIDKPFSIAQVIKGEATGSGVYIQGYIVGFVNGASISSGATFSAENASASNVLLADEAGCTDVAKCIPVQLVANSAPRASVNLKDNPGNLGKQVELKGDITLYFNVNGLKSTSEAILK